jgi:hypothetical protein
VRQPPLSCAPRFSGDHFGSVQEFARVQWLDPPRHCAGGSVEIARQKLKLTLIDF